MYSLLTSCYWSCSLNVLRILYSIVLLTFYTKEIKNASECIVELYKHTGIFKNTREVLREAQGTAECFSHFSTVLKNSQVLIYKCNSTMHEDEVFYFFYKNNAKEIARAHTRDVSSVHYNSIKHACDLSHMLYGAIMNLNWPITMCAISQTFIYNNLQVISRTTFFLYLKC